MTIPVSTLLWLLIAVAAFVTGYILGRRSMMAGSAPARPHDYDAPQPRHPQPQGERPMIDDNPLPAPGAPARPRAAPPPASAGGERPADPHGRAPTSTVPPRSGVAPPPASAGGGTASRHPAGREAAAKPARGGDSDADPDPAAAARRKRPQALQFADVSSWGYQLQKLDLARAAASPFDCLVIDYSKDGSDEEALTAAQLDKLKTAPGGKRRIVLAYLSIGEAESYRFYWQDAWKKEPPPWLLGENPEWHENYTVCFWDGGWQRVICGGKDSYLDRIIDAGFDGVYLDKCDAYEDIQERLKKVAKARPGMERDMVAFVQRLSAYAKSKVPNFIVVMQNAEGLLEHSDLRAALDGVAKEELVFGMETPEKRNAKDEIDYSRRALDRMKADGKPVLVVEYLNNQGKIAEAADAVGKLGYVLYIAPKNRELDRLNYEVLEA